MFLQARRGHPESLNLRISTTSDYIQYNKDIIVYKLMELSMLKPIFELNVFTTPIVQLIRCHRCFDRLHLMQVNLVARSRCVEDLVRLCVVFLEDSWEKSCNLVGNLAEHVQIAKILLSFHMAEYTAHRQMSQQVLVGYPRSRPCSPVSTPLVPASWRMAVWCITVRKRCHLSGWVAQDDGRSFLEKIMPKRF